MKIWIISKKQLFTYIFFGIIAVAFFIWLLIPTGSYKFSINKPSSQSIVTKRLSYTPEASKRKDNRDWQVIRQKSPYVFMTNKYFNKKISFNKSNHVIQLRVKKKYLKVLNRKPDGVLNDMIIKQMHKDANTIQKKTNATQVAITVINHSGLMVVND